MAKRLYNVRAYSDTTANWAQYSHLPIQQPAYRHDTGAIKKGDGVKAYAQLGAWA